MHLPRLLACFVTGRNFVLVRCHEVCDRHTGGLQDTARRNFCIDEVLERSKNVKSRLVASVVSDICLSFPASSNR
jgi:hypothetical protein